MTEPNDRLKQARREKRGRGRSRKKFWKHHDRNSYICPDCGATADETERFEVHHIDGDPMNTDLENLRGLCQACHYQHHGRTPPRTLNDWKDGFEEYATTGETQYVPRN